ncbi:hypothetical protein [Streptomyces hydrogenans]|uniref:hypothetical protein n=1 Tax=Streptomyces hydrogenans TaxID=1873719 RepID=UPI00381DDC93
MRWPFTRRRRPSPFPAHTPAPLHTPGSTPAAEAMPLAIALRIAREALARHADADVNSRPAMYFAAVDLDHALRLLVAALDNPQDS